MFTWIYIIIIYNYILYAFIYFSVSIAYLKVYINNYIIIYYSYTFIISSTINTFWFYVGWNLAEQICKILHFLNINYALKYKISSLVGKYDHIQW